MDKKVVFFIRKKIDYIMEDLLEIFNGFSKDKNKRTKHLIIGLENFIRSSKGEFNGFNDPVLTGELKKILIKIVLYLEDEDKYLDIDDINDNKIFPHLNNEDVILLIFEMKHKISEELLFEYQYNLENYLEINKSLEREFDRLISDLVKYFFENSNDKTEFYRNRFDDIYEDLLIMHHQIDPSGKIIDCNSTFCKKLGYSKEEIVGKNEFEFQTEASRAIGRKELKESLEKNMEVFIKYIGKKELKETLNKLNTVYERQFRKKNGEVIDVLLCTKFIFDERNLIRGGNVTMIDVTENKILGRKLRELEIKGNT